MKKQLLGFAALVAMAFTTNAQTVSDFENPALPQQGFLNGKYVPTTGYILSGGITFNNHWETNWGGYWGGGIAVSNMRNDSTAGFLNMYSAITGKGFNSQNYGVAQNGTKVTIPATKNVHGVYITNSTYAYMSMNSGDQFAKKFGGVSGNDADSFVLVAKGYHNGTLMTEEARIHLADFTFSDNTQDYILKQWKWFNLSELMLADSLVFSLESSDAGANGVNTPLYFCMDDFTVTDDNLTQTITAATFEEVRLKLDDYWNGQPLDPFKGFANGNAFFNNTFSYFSGWESWSGFALSNIIDTTTAGFTNQYASAAGKGVNASSNYMVATGSAKVVLTGAAAGKAINGFYITNSTYAYMSMKNGDQFAKKFGGVAGSDPDFFELVIKAHKGGSITDSSVVALADFRSNNSSEDYILKTWKWVDLQPLGNVDSLSFSFRSSDVGQYGINTPLYFCMDNFTTNDASSTPVITTGNVDAFVCAGKTFNLSFNSTDSFNSANVFNAQLSDSTGSFVAAVNIGSLTATHSNVIAVTLPSYAVGSNYKIRVISSNPAVEGTASNSFIIGAKPMPVIVGDTFANVGETKIFAVAHNTGSGYKWFYTNATGTNDSAAVRIIWNTDFSTTVKVIETSSQGCVSDTVSKNVEVFLPIGLNKIAGNLNATVYPNPANNVVNVSLATGFSNLSITMFDVTGKKVLSTSETSFSVSTLNKGIYMMVIEADGKASVKRVVVE